MFLVALPEKKKCSDELFRLKGLGMRSEGQTASAATSAFANTSTCLLSHRRRISGGDEPYPNNA
jgi:hypothetical protein